MATNAGKQEPDIRNLALELADAMRGRAARAKEEAQALVSAAESMASEITKALGEFAAQCDRLSAFCGESAKQIADTGKTIDAQTTLPTATNLPLPDKIMIAVEEATIPAQGKEFIAEGSVKKTARQ